MPLHRSLRCKHLVPVLSIVVMLLLTVEWSSWLCRYPLRRGVPVDMALLLGVSDDDPVQLVAPSELGAGDLSALPVLAVHSFLSDEVGGAKEAFVAF